MIGRAKVLPVAFIHDEQNQFAKSFREIWRVFTNLIPNADSLALFSNVKPSNLGGCKFEMRASTDSIGLQLTDVLLWLAKKSISGTHVRGNAGRLLRDVLSHGDVMEFSRQQLGQTVAMGIAELNASPVDSESMARGMALFEELERKRIGAGEVKSLTSGRE